MSSFNQYTLGMLFDTNQFGGGISSDLMESQWGDIVDPREYLYDTPDWFGTTTAGPSPSNIADRLNGDFHPIYRCEQDLAIIRGISHSLLSFEPRAIGLTDLLGNYIFGKGGFSYIVRPEPGADSPAGLVDLVQDFIDRFLDDNDVQNDLDKEIHRRSREDGEAPVFLEVRKGEVIPRIRTLEPDQITEPVRGAELEEYIEETYGVDCSLPTSWKYGVHAYDKSPDRLLGVHVIYGNGNQDWEYYPADRFEMFKRNVPRNAKRGVSDFHWVWSDMGNEAKLRRNTVTGATIQAAIAYIREHIAGTSQTKASGLVTDQRTGTVGQSFNGGTRQISVKRHNPGTVLDISQGMKYLPGPMGAERNSSLLTPGEYVLRCVGARWQTPEYMISNDASNGNYASTLVAESPFVKARESDQEWYAKKFLSVIWKALKIGWEGGYFDSVGISWEDLMRVVDIKCVTPDVATRDPLAVAQRQQIEISAGILSKETAIAESGRDPEEELPKIKAEQSAAAAAAGQATGPSPTGPSALQGAIQGAMESVETPAEMKSILHHISEVIYP